MPRVGSEPMIKVFEGTRTFRGLHRAATVLGIYLFKRRIYFQIKRALGYALYFTQSAFMTAHTRIALTTSQ
jgi:hypothetical protein